MWFVVHCRYFASVVAAPSVPVTVVLQVICGLGVDDERGTERKVPEEFNAFDKRHAERQVVRIGLRLLRLVSLLSIRFMFITILLFTIAAGMLAPCLYSTLFLRP